PSPRRLLAGGEPSRSGVAAKTGGGGFAPRRFARRRAGGEERPGPPGDVLAAHPLAQPAHAGGALGGGQIQGAGEGPGGGADVVRVDQERAVGELGRGAGEFRQHQRPLLVEVGGAVLLGDEVHSFLQGG